MVLLQLVNLILLREKLKLNQVKIQYEFNANKKQIANENSNIFEKCSDIMIMEDNKNEINNDLMILFANIQESLSEMGLSIFSYCKMMENKQNVEIDKLKSANIISKLPLFQKMLTKTESKLIIYLNTRT